MEDENAACHFELVDLDPAPFEIWATIYHAAELVLVVPHWRIELFDARAFISPPDPESGVETVAQDRQSDVPKELITLDQLIDPTHATSATRPGVAAPPSASDGPWRLFTHLLDRIEEEGPGTRIQVAVHFDPALADQVPLIIAGLCDNISAEFDIDDYDPSTAIYKSGGVEVAFFVPSVISITELVDAVRRRHMSLENLVRQLLAERTEPDNQDPLRWLPSLVAVPYAMIDGPQLGMQTKWSAARGAMEAAIRYIACVGLISLAGDRVDDKIASLQAEFKKDRPALGDFVGAIRRHRDVLLNRLPNTSLSLWNAKGKPTELGRYLDEFVKLRNDGDAHGADPPEAQLVPLYEQLRRGLDSIVGALARDGRTRLPVVQHDMNFSEDVDGTYEYRLTELRGASIVLPVSRVTSNATIKRGRVYLALPGDEFLEADPLIIYEPCPACAMTEAFVLDQFSAKKPVWRNPRGHKILARAT